MSSDPVVDQRIRERMIQLQSERRGKGNNIYIHYTSPFGDKISLNITNAILHIPDETLRDLIYQMTWELNRRGTKAG